MKDEQEDRGVEAIIALQAMAGITEPEERARRSWRRFSPRERIVTMNTYLVLKGNVPERPS